MITVPLEIVPDPDEDGTALPFAELTVGGVRLRAVLDSGAARSSLVQRPGLVGREGGAEGAGVFGGRQTERRAELPVRFAGRDLGPMELSVVPPDHPGHGDLIGQDVLGRYRCEYRLAEATLVLDGPAPEGAQAVFVDEGGHVYVEVRWPAGPVGQTVLDTGASVTVVDAAFVDRHRELFTPDGHSQGMDASGEQVSTPMVTMAPMSVLGSDFGVSRVAVVDLTAAHADLERPMDLILGWPVLSQGAFFVDHPGRRAAHRF